MSAAAAAEAAAETGMRHPHHHIILYDHHQPAHVCADLVVYQNHATATPSDHAVVLLPSARCNAGMKSAFLPGPDRDYIQEGNRRR